jgi:predicted hydrocarbon binding protein
VEGIGDVNGVATLLKSMGETYGKMGDIGKAIERLKKVQKIFEELNIEVQVEETNKLLAEVKKQLNA